MFSNDSSIYNYVVACRFIYENNNWGTGTENGGTTDYMYAVDDLYASEGYFVYPFDNDIVVIPQLLTGDAIVTINKSNESVLSELYYALGNPFYANLDITTTNLLNQIQGQTGAYVYNSNSNDWYDTLFTTIKPGQGFFVAGKEGSTTLSTTLTNPNYTSNTTTSSKKSAVKSTENNRIIFSALANGITRRVHARQNENAENDFDVKNSYIMFSPNNTKLVEPYFVVDNRNILINEYKTLPYIAPINFYAHNTVDVDFSASNVPYKRFYYKSIRQYRDRFDRRTSIFIYYRRG